MALIIVTVIYYIIASTRGPLRQWTSPSFFSILCLIFSYLSLPLSVAADFCFCLSRLGCSLFFLFFFFLREACFYLLWINTCSLSVFSFIFFVYYFWFVIPFSYFSFVIRSVIYYSIWSYYFLIMILLKPFPRQLSPACLILSSSISYFTSFYLFSLRSLHDSPTTSFFPNYTFPPPFHI